MHRIKAYDEEDGADRYAERGEKASWTIWKRSGLVIGFDIGAYRSVSRIRSEWTGNSVRGDAYPVNIF